MRAAWMVAVALGLVLWLAGPGAPAGEELPPPPPPPGEPGAPAEPPPALRAERPQRTETAQSAPDGYGVVEYGLGYRLTEAAQLLDLPGLLVRYGLGSGWEIRVGFAGLDLAFPEDGPSETEIAPLTLGGKYAFTLGDGLDLSLSGLVGLPLKGEAYDSKGVSLGFKLAGGLALAEWVRVGANFGVDVLGLGASSAAQERVYLASLVLAFSASERVRLFLEGYGEIPEVARDGARAVLQAGFVFQPAPHWQVDGYLGLDLMHTPDAVVAGLGSALLW